MSPVAVLRTERDVYANLLHDTRGLRREQAATREAWFGSLAQDRKAETLFELEMLLKGIACFGNARNHPGPPGDKSTLTHDFHEELLILRDAFAQVVTLTRALLGERERARTLSRYPETPLPEDAARRRLLQDHLTQDTPEDSLLALRNSFGHFVDVADGLQRSGRISSRVYAALHEIVVREIGRNVYFNPLMALEFRPEFDRIRNPEVLEVLDAIESASAHRVVALAFLTLFRGLRYLGLIENDAVEGIAARRAYVILAAFRSDLRALTQYLRRRSADVIADGLEKEILDIPASEISMQFTRVAESTRALLRVRSTLENLGTTLRIEIKKVFELDLPPPGAGVAAHELGPRLVTATNDLRGSLHRAIHALCDAIRPGQPLPELGADAAARRAASDRLRREVWMFKQVVRAFIAKADAARLEYTEGAHDRWAGEASSQFVRDFVAHFRAIGYQLAHSHHYERLDPLVAGLARLGDVDFLDPVRLDEVVDECQVFLDFLTGLFDHISRRTELADLPFDRQAATETLKIYLGRS